MYAAAAAVSRDLRTSFGITKHIAGVRLVIAVVLDGARGATSGCVHFIYSSALARSAIIGQWLIYCASQRPRRVEEEEEVLWITNLYIVRTRQRAKMKNAT